MTEPIAYMWKTVQGTVVGLEPNDDNYSQGEFGIPLYTAEQLKPRVKMTQAEFDEFKQLIEEHGLVLEALQAIYNGKYKNLNSKLFNGRTVESDNKQVKILTNLMSEFDPNNPEETIEIIPDMKWFVRSKKRDDEGDYAFMSGIETVEDWGYSEHHDGVNEARACAYPFDTQDEAELWVTPITEAVQLPVKGE